MDIKKIENEKLSFEETEFSLRFERKVPVPNGCKYIFKPTIKISKNKLEKAINDSQLSQYSREVFLLGVSFIESS